jgi:hypothetical protein
LFCNPTDLNSPCVEKSTNEQATLFHQTETCDLSYLVRLCEFCVTLRESIGLDLLLTLGSNSYVYFSSFPSMNLFCASTRRTRLQQLLCKRNYSSQPLSLEIMRKFPKAELHCHLDGSLKVQTIIELAKEQVLPLPHVRLRLTSRELNCLLLMQRNFLPTFQSLKTALRWWNICVALISP